MTLYMCIYIYDYIRSIPILPDALPGAPGPLLQLQVLNPNFGTLKQMLECCGKSRDYAGKMATLLNTNSILDLTDNGRGYMDLAIGNILELWDMMI